MNLIECNECCKVFKKSTIHIYEQDINFENKVLSLTYFMCPRCSKVYPVFLADEEIRTLKNELQEQKAKLSRMVKKHEEIFGKGKSYDVRIENQVKLVQKKYDRVSRKSKKLLLKYRGKFVFDVNAGEIVYLP